MIRVREMNPANSVGVDLCFIVGLVTSWDGLWCDHIIGKLKKSIHFIE
ncbi:MAG: hypothetical protein AB1733_21200 [Thermodesulfobacteriota bacterium]